VRLLDERRLRATFFCTHAGIEIPGHERALHPNFRRNGDAAQGLHQQLGGDYATLSDAAVYRHVLAAARTFCPEARGVRAHSLRYDTELVALYRDEGLEYDSTYCLPLVADLAPFWKEHELLEIPIYYMDHLELLAPRTGFEVDRLGLERPGLKVFDFHPNMVYTNAPTNDFYLATKPVYRDPAQLRSQRYPGRGARTMLLDLLDRIADRQLRTATLGQVNDAWRNRL
jgi:hypothetical protein